MRWSKEAKEKQRSGKKTSKVCVMLNFMCVLKLGNSAWLFVKHQSRCCYDAVFRSD